MADFELRIAQPAGTPVVPLQWTDAQRAPGTNGADDKGRPARTNFDTDAPGHHFRVPLNTAVYIEAGLVNGSVIDWIPTDAAAVRTWTIFEAERPQGSGPLSFVGTAGSSSQQTFTPTARGHYTLIMRRDTGGAVVIHLDVA